MFVISLALKPPKETIKLLCMLLFGYFQLGFLNSHFTEMDRVGKKWLSSTFYLQYLTGNSITLLAIYLIFSQALTMTVSFQQEKEIFKVKR